MCPYVSVSLFLFCLSVVHICIHMDAYVTQDGCDNRRQTTENFAFLHFLGALNSALILSISGKRNYACNNLSVIK